jgi:hypothetical protein
MTRRYEYRKPEDRVITVAEARVVAEAIINDAVEQEPGPVGIPEYSFGMTGQYVNHDLAIAALEQLRAENRISFDRSGNIQYPSQ